MIQVYWGDEEETYVVWHFSPCWTVDDHARAMDINLAFVTSKPYTVDIIADLTITIPTPEMLKIGERALRQSPDNLGLMVFIIKSRVWMGILDTLDSMGALKPIGRRYKFVRDMDAAVKVLEKRRATSINE